jgi:hypothetical protein
MQNADYFGVMKCKIPKFSESRLVPSKMQNLLSSREPLEALFGFFFGLLRPKYKIKNNHLFTKNFALCLVPFYKMMDQNLKFFRKKRELNIPICRLDYSSFPLMWEFVEPFSHYKKWCFT